MIFMLNQRLLAVFDSLCFYLACQTNTASNFHPNIVYISQNNVIFNNLCCLNIENKRRKKHSLHL